MSWKKHRLADFCELSYGKSLKKEVRIESGIFPVYGSSGIVGYHNEYLSKGPTIVIGRKGSIGTVFFSEKPCWAIDTAFYLTPSEKFYPKFLYYQLTTLRLNELDKSAAIPGLSRSDAYDKTIVVPPIPVQKQIANTLDKADELLRKDQELIQKYDELMHSIFYEMFGDPIRNEGGWELMQLGELCVIKRGASPRPIDKFIGNDVHWIKIGDGTGEDDIYIKDTRVKITLDGAKKSVLLQPGSLIFANCGVSLGFARILEIPGCIHDGWLSIEIKNKNKLDQVFLLKLINNITPFLRSLAPEGTQPNLNTKIMKDLPIIVPPLSYQKKFTQKVKLLIDYKKHLSNGIERSEHLFSAILKKYFS